MIDSLEGSLPVWLYGRGDTAELYWFASADLAMPEPFFMDTVSRWQNQGTAPRVTGLSALREFSQGNLALPCAFIFHVSHCGSTLLANALKTVPQALVLAEPPLMRADQLLRPPVDSQLVRGAINAFARASTRTRYLFVKYMNVLSLFMPWFRQTFPSPAFVFVYRDPREVIASKIAEVSEENRLQSIPLMRHLLGRAPDWNPTAAEYWSAVYEAQCTAAMACPDVVYLDYRELTAERVHTLFRQIGVSAAEIDPRALRESLARYSKDPTGTKAFSPDDDTAKQRARDLVAGSEQLAPALGAYRRLAAMAAGSARPENE